MIYTKKTIKEKITFKGIGVHTGKKSVLSLNPAKNTGIVFIHKGQSLSLDIRNVTKMKNAVTLSNGRIQIQTIEHLLAALATFQITDLIVEVSHFEIPILDGSSFEFFRAIEKVGILDLRETIEPIRMEQTLCVKEKDKHIIAYPSDKFTVSYSINFEHPLLKEQTFDIELNYKNLKKEILPARTFGFLKDFESLKKEGLALGSSEENTVIFNKTHYQNQSLRYENEAIRHKILDLVGDLYVLGRPILAHFVVYKAGHKLDIEMVKLIHSFLQSQEMFTTYETPVNVLIENF